METKIILCEKHIYPLDWSWLPHEHEDSWHLYYIKDGDCIFEVDGKKIPTTNGDLLIVPCRTMHALGICRKADTDVLEVMFKTDDPVLAPAIRRKAPLGHAQTDDLPLLDMIERCGASRVESISSYAAAALVTLLVRFCGDAIDMSPLTINAAFMDTSGFSSITKKVIGYIDSKFRKDISLDMIAEYADCNKCYMCTVFRRDTGITINNYLNAIRIHHAAEYLSYSDREVAEICTMVGFRNVAHFYRTFRDYMGTSPQSYKRFSAINLNTDSRNLAEIRAFVEKV